MKFTKQVNGLLAVFIMVLSPSVPLLNAGDYPHTPMSVRSYYLRAVIAKVVEAKERETIPLLTLGPGGKMLTIGITLEDVEDDKGADAHFTSKEALGIAAAIINVELKPRVSEEMKVIGVHGMNLLKQDVYFVEYGFTHPGPVNGAGYPGTLFIPIFQYKKTSIKLLPNGKQEHSNPRKK